MASKANINRKRIMRSAILTASMLSLIPLVGVMQGTATKTDSNVIAAVASTGETLAAGPISYETTQPSATAAATSDAAIASTAATKAATTASSTTAKQTSSGTQTTAAASYTRTKAS